jgi:hypothetical protein
MPESATEIYPLPSAPEISGSLDIDIENNPENETVLTAQILQLWEIYRTSKDTAKEQTQRLRIARQDLSRVLFQMKQALAKPGRNGEWSSWLREKGIPRATGDRLARKYERSLNPVSNCINEAISAPTEAEIQKALKTVLPKLRHVLQTPQSAYHFITLLISVCDGIGRQVTDAGIFIAKPQAEPTAGESVPEPESITCGIAVGTDQEPI